MTGETNLAADWSITILFCVSLAQYDRAPIRKLEGGLSVLALLCARERHAVLIAVLGTAKCTASTVSSTLPCSIK